MEKSIQLYPIYDVWHQPWWQTSWFLYVTVLVLSAVLACIVWYTWFLYKRKKASRKPWEIALIKIDQLLYSTSHNVDVSSQEVYLRLTVILKNYLQARYGFDVESKTDEELLLYLEQASLHRDLVKLFREIVEDGTQAKFAKLTVLKDIMVKDLQYCTEIIKKTIPQSSR